MDLHDQLKKLFPDHEPDNSPELEITDVDDTLWVQKDPMICKYEKRNGKPTTIIEGYTGHADDFKKLAKILKTKLSVGGTVKGESIILQGDYRDKIMKILQEIGFKVKRVGG